MSVSATAVCQWHVTDNWRIKELYLHIYSPIYIFTHYICCTLPKNNMVTKSVKIGRNQKRKGSSPFCHQFSRAFAVSFKFGVWPNTGVMILPTQTMHSYTGNHSNLPYTPTCNLRIYNPGKGKSSSKSPFSGSMLIFGGVHFECCIIWSPPQISGPIS